jgi:hypothetical protein
MQKRLRDVAKDERSWFGLLAFFAATTLASSLLLAAVLAGVTVAIAGGEISQNADRQQFDPIVPSQVFSGVVTDVSCGARHRDPKKNAADCARQCAQNGASYAIVDGDRTYIVTGNPMQFAQLAGQRVTFTGVLEGNTIKVNAESLEAHSVH